MRRTKSPRRAATRNANAAALPQQRTAMQGRALAGHNSLSIEWMAIPSLTLPSRNARKHSKRQIDKLVASLDAFGFNVPVLVNDQRQVIAGSARIEAAKRLGMTAVPCISLRHLTETQARAFMIAENRISELGTWDDQILAEELKVLSSLDLDFDIEATGFEVGEIDLRIESLEEGGGEEDDDALLTPDPGPAITQPGDLWILGRHRLFCGNALEPKSYQVLLGDERARMIFSDPPYNVKIDGHASGLGAIKHREFAMASGEMSETEFEAMLLCAMRLMVRHSTSGSIHMLAMDWRHAHTMLNAGSLAYTELKNICAWVKHNAGMGAFYRSQHEFFFIFKNGKAPHRNNFRLGELGRHRTNVWTYPGIGGFGASSEDGNLLALHPTVKPTLLVVDAILDCSARNDIVLDVFAGSGTTILACERTGRRGRAIELDPQYVDVSIRRWQRHTGADAVLESTGETFNARARRMRREGNT